jgi:hypothetical protein
MKYTGFLCLLLLSVGVSAPAQEDDIDLGKAKLFEGRLISGFNFTQIMGDNNTGFHKVGLNVGGAVYIRYKEHFGASFELLYSQKGVRGANVKESYTVGTYFDKYYLNLDYVEAALLLHFKLFVLDYEGGISYARLVHSKEWAEADVPVHIDNNLWTFKPYDINYLIGLSYRINKRWAVNFRFQYSAISIRPRERVPPRYSDGSDRQLNQMACLRLMYVIK